MIQGLLLAAIVAADAGAVHRYYDTHDDVRLVPMLQEVIRFPTFAGNVKAHADQKEWLTKTASGLGLDVRDAGPVTEIELPGPKGAPVLGLVIHGDVQPVEEAAWSAPPFAGVVRDGAVWGRGAADDKGPLVQALLAMHALRESGVARTHTVRLLVGSDEESGATDITTYLKAHAPPDYSLVLDALFPVVVGEKAWNALRLTAADAAEPPASGPWRVESLEAGLSPSIVPDRARLVLRWRSGDPDWTALRKRIQARAALPGTTLEAGESGHDLVLTMKGRSAHSGVNIEGGRNALVSLANVVAEDLPPGGAGDLLRFVRKAGVDLRGTGLELPPPDALWRGYDVAPAMVQVLNDSLTLTINIRRPLPWKAADLKRHLEGVVERFNREHGTRLVMDPTFFYDDEPFAVDPQSPLVQRLMAAYRRATGEKDAQATVMGGGSYAKRMPRSIVFGMWFGDKPYPGHDVDEHVPIDDLRRGAHVLIEGLVDLACGEPLKAPLSVLTAP